MTDEDRPETAERRPLSIVLRAELAEVDRAREFLRERLRGLPFGEEDQFKIELAMVEMCVNITRYAYRGPAGDMDLSFWIDGGRIVLEIRDAGLPFDPRSVPDPEMDAIVNGERTGGLGIYLARRLMDAFDYRREDGRNIVTLIKKIPVSG
jgi:serine/threonine-protein kinase RsbW